jgi:subtilisin family serine protease
MANKYENAPRDPKGRISVLMEMRADPGQSVSLGHGMAAGLAGGLELDAEFSPVPMSGGGEGLSGAPASFILRGTVANEDDLKRLEADPKVLRVWKDTPIEPFAKKPAKSDNAGMSPKPELEDSGAMAACPIGTCDCNPNLSRGTMADVARYLGVDQIWAAGFRGAGMVVGVLDSGITAQGRPVKAGETTDRIARVIGGWPVADWGTESGRWGNHGNMCATDVLGMAPEAQLLDLRIAGPGGSPSTISRALQAFQFAIDRFRVNGTPQVLTNSWGIFQESWDASYARDPNHPFTRKVVEAADLGIIVLFAAGNCGDTCPDGRCGPDVGTGRSIWGANGHEKVMTVGAVNIHEQFVGYSSRGPAALSPNKPDFCSVTHFRGYFDPDSGTSAATPILAGVCALLKQAKPARTPAQMKTDLIATCKDIGAVGFDVHSGHGIVRAKGAYDRMVRPPKPPILDTTPVRDLVQTRPWLDDPRTVVALDDPRTVVVLDDPRTPIALDVVQTHPVLDQMGTRPLLDQGGTPVVVDQVGTPIIADTAGTPVVLDRGGTPIVLDNPGTPPGLDQGGTPISEGIDWPPRDWRPEVPGQGEQPFVLSTGHYAPDWRTFDDMVGGQTPAMDPLTELVSRIDAAQAVLDHLVAQYQALAGQDPGHFSRA